MYAACHFLDGKMWESVFKVSFRVFCLSIKLGGACPNQSAMRHVTWQHCESQSNVGHRWEKFCWKVHS